VTLIISFYIMKKITVFAMALVALIANASADNLKIQDKFTPLGPGAVHLHGFLEDPIQKSINNWNKGVVPYDEFVEFFRKGRPQFALGEMWGKAVRSGCMFYRYSHDPELKKILADTVKDILSTQRANGSISCTEPEKQPDGPMGDLWERKYVMLGLLEYYQWVDEDPKVMESLKKQVDALMEQVGHAPKKEITDLGWSGTLSGLSPNHIESSTILEPVMRLYKITGEQRYLDFAKYIVDAGGTHSHNLVQQAIDNVDPYKMGGDYPKAYEQTSFFEGLVEYYRVTGDERIKTAFLNMFRNVKDKEITIVGNAGANQPYHPSVYGEAWSNTKEEQTNPDITRMMETCVGVTWMKFCSQVMRITGDSAPADYMEKYIYNGLLGAMKPTGDGFSYVNLLNGCKVTNEGWGWKFNGLPVTCCNLNGPMGLAYIPYAAAMSSAEGPVVNFFQAADIVTSSPSGAKVGIKISGDFPMSGIVKVKVSLEDPEEFALRVRIPDWSSKTVLRVNGEEEKATPGTYAVLKREWKTGDEVALDLDMRCRLVEGPKGSNRKGDNMVALVRGPVVLARDENVDKGYNDPVAIASEDGYVTLTPEKSTKGARMQFKVPLKDGGFISMVDYASVDNWDGSKVRTWLPAKK